ncbi:Spermine synthase [Rhodomicrobium vannielii ATCC 17100]|uniref:Spermine synthase n=1 Tax=Rhodomicrobium vannielii (strain ATCC 17100 / DSM 162 / LMG 4299 / NCIMB 10020 / ATH 3.1.1) TaxID=648757 RepID=E3HZK9_RHOVT|nr:spermidine synthase [Rhodomicrobium vannielii]ADP71044.1 Spermine synthase [Rhodomicrobium vannielii ATCC 17100]
MGTLPIASSRQPAVGEASIPSPIGNIVSRSLHLTLLYVLLFLSGFAGLGYEIVWTRMLSVGLGHEIIAVLAVIAAFFSGLALGAWALDGPVSRSRVPGRWYAAFELIIAVWSVALVALIPAANRFVATLIGADPSPALHWAIAFIVPFALLLPATVAMGGTLPAMERLFSRLAQDGWSVGALYAANTFGAFAGALLTTFVIVPHLGVSGALLTLAAANVLCATGVALGAARGESVRPPVDAASAIPGGGRLFVTLFITGLIGIGYEVLVVRALAQVMENTVYSFASALSVYLLGTALGAALYQRFVRGGDFDATLTRLLQAACGACLFGIVLLSAAPAAYDFLLNLFGRSFAGSVASEIGIASLVFLLPTIVMGALFSHLAQGARGASGGLGRALAFNTLGAALAPILFGVVALPMLGSLLTLTAVSLCYLVMIPQRGPRALLPASLGLAAGLALLLLPLNLNNVSVPPGGRVLEYVEGVIAAVSVVADDKDIRYLKVDNHFRMGSTATKFSDRRQSHIPLLLHPDPKRALFLGIGTGATFAGAADFPGLEADGVELVPEILSLLPNFEAVTGDFRKMPKLRLLAADARRYIQASDNKYDVIVADLFHPALDGSGSLYTREHFAAIRARLAEGGIFCQWLPLHQLDLETLGTITRTFQSVYPNATAYLAHYSLQTPLLALVSGTKPMRFSANWLDARLSDPQLQQKLKDSRLDDPYALFGAFVAGPDDLRGVAGDGPLNTDDRPLVTFRAPSTVYTPLGPSGERLVDLIDRFRPQPQQVLLAPVNGESDAEARLAAYWKARNQFLKAGLGVSPSNDVNEMVRRVREPLLAVVRTSSDFEPAYMPLLSLASALVRVDREAARSLLTDLAEANPTRHEAQRLLDGIAASR